MLFFRPFLSKIALCAQINDQISVNLLPLSLIRLKLTIDEAIYLSGGIHKLNKMRKKQILPILVSTTQ